jgi:uncharacterized protein YggE
MADTVRKATENARTLAEAAGVKLGRILQMDYGWSEVRIYESDARLVSEGAPPPPPCECGH